MENETANLDGSLKLVQEKLSSTYKFIRSLGGGVFSNVYLVKHNKSGEDFALKVLDYHFLLQKFRKENRQDPHSKITEIKKRFIAEAKLYKKIHHPNIVTIHDTGVIEAETGGLEIPYMVMAYIKGDSLSDLLKRRAPFSVERSLEISKDVLEALTAIHQNKIIHRDIKPANIMIENETGKAVIIDFGIAKDIVGGSRLTTTGSSIGTPPYMAPEQFVDSSKVDHTIDIYSFGIVLYEMLTGKAPFDGHNFAEIMNAHREKPIPDPRQINPQIPQTFIPVITKAMAKVPKNRYQSTVELLNALMPMQSSIPFSVPYKNQQFRNLRRIAFLIVLIIAMGAIFLYLFNTPEKKTEPQKKRLSQNSVSNTEKKSPVESPPESNPLDEPLQEFQQEFNSLKQSINLNSINEKQIESCKLFLSKYKTLIDSKAEETKPVVSEITGFITQMTAALELDSQYKKFIDSAKQLRKSRQYDKAIEQLTKAQAVKDTEELHKLITDFQTQKKEEENINGINEYNSILKDIDLDKYREFKKNFPDSFYLLDLENKLKEKDPRLPPKKYWTSLKKNTSGFYEFTFDGESNGHCMIYIPKRRLWFDKYEVSNYQYREFFKLSNNPVPAVTSSGYIHSGDEYPVVVSYSEAQNYCRKFGYRLPRIDEWEYAAGKGVDTYPWGNDIPGAEGKFQANFDSLSDEGNIEKDGFRGTAPVNSFTGFPSYCGALNMAGNVWEWVQGRILKGGSFISLPEQLLIKNSIAGRDDETQGFRCVKEEPL